MKSLKIGDKVIMNKHGFHFYHNPDIQFEMNNVRGEVNRKHFLSAFIEALALTGVGTIKRFNSEGSPYIRWECKMNGMYFYHEHYFESESIQRIGLLQRLRLKLKALL
jgi:hypothetical protein